MKKSSFLISFLLIFLISNIWAEDLSNLQSGFQFVELENEFGEKTGGKRLCAVCVGEFSNSATAKSDLAVQILIDNKNTCYLSFLEYLNNRAVFCSDVLNFSVKDGAGKINYFTIKTPKNVSTHIDCYKLLPLLYKGGNLEVVVNNKTATYKFFIDATNFKELYSVFN